MAELWGLQAGPAPQQYGVTWPSCEAHWLDLLSGQVEEKELAWPLRALWLLESKLGPQQQSSR